MIMAITFASIPVATRTPGTYVEVDNSRAVGGTPAKLSKAVIIAQQLATATQDEAVLTLVSNASQAETLFGAGSQAASMVRAYKAANRYTPLYVVALDDEAGTQATKTLTYTASSAQAGSVYLYIGGRRIAVAVAEDDTAPEIAAAVVAAINAYLPALPVTAAAGTGESTHIVTLTLRHYGTCGNFLDVRHNYGNGETFPSGVGCTIAAGATGATDPAYSAAITALGNEQFESIIVGNSDDTQLDLIEAALETRWGPMVATPGICFGVVRGADLAADLALGGAARNSKHSCIMTSNQGLTPIWEQAAAIAAADDGEPDPARPRQTLEIVGMVPPATTDQYVQSERNQLLYAGISTFEPVSGKCYISRLITTYQLNGAGVADPSYLDLTTMRTLAYIRYAVAQRMALRFPRHKLVADGTRFSPGQAVCTPSAARAELIALFTELEAAALVEGFDQFKDDLLVEINGDDPNRLDILMAPNLANQLRVCGVQIQFLL
jgi:phage tail sheath gpL-like